MSVGSANNKKSRLLNEVTLDEEPSLETSKFSLYLLYMQIAIFPSINLRLCRIKSVPEEIWDKDVKLF
jgi:hypothetical protein